MPIPSLTLSTDISALIASANLVAAKAVLGLAPTDTLAIGGLSLPDNVRQTFNPGAAAAGFNVGAVTADPSTPVDGDIWYNSSAGLLKVRKGGVTEVIGSAGINPQSVTAYTLTPSDSGKVIALGHSSAITLTLPTGMPSWFHCKVVQSGAGTITFIAEVDAEVQSFGSLLTTQGLYASVDVVIIAADTFLLAGNLQ